MSYIKKKKAVLRIIAKSYIFPIVFAVVVCYIKKHIDFLKIQNDNVNEVMKSTLTVSSILFGFFGTMLGQLISLKSKYEEDKNNIITRFFEDVNGFEIHFIMKANVFNTIVIDLFSILIMFINRNVFMLVLWFCALSIFVFNLLYVYFVFINLLLYKKRTIEVQSKMSDEEVLALKNRLNNKQ